jgi:hypothetical protein
MKYCNWKKKIEKILNENGKLMREKMIILRL